MAKGLYAGVAGPKPTVTLPEGYTQLEYIESTGTQYIDTGFKPDSNTRVVMSFQFSSAPSTWACVFGSADVAQNNVNSFAVWHNASTFSYQYATKLSASFSNAITAVDKHSVDCNSSTATIDNETVTINGGTFSGSYNMYLSCVNYGGEALHFASEKIYFCQIYDNGTLIRNFIPAKNSGGIYGLYDTVNSEFYTNAGSGTFIAGTAIDGSSFAGKANKMYVGVANKPTVELPSGYTQVEYIESSGTQYIDTGFKPNNNTRVVMDFQLTSIGGSVNNWACIFGSSDTTTNINSFALWHTGEVFAYYYGANTNKTFPSTLIGTEEYLVDCNSETATMNGNTVSVSSATFSGAYPLCLFGVNYGDDVSHLVKCKLKYCQIYDNGTLARNLVPVQKSDGTVGMYDTINSKFYTNGGSGTFMVGKAYDGKSLAGKVKKGYISVNGIARLFFGGLELKYKGTATILSSLRYSLASATIGNYALFAGGYGSTVYATVDAYDDNLTKTTASELSLIRHSLAGGSTDSRAIFAGGYSGATASDTVDSYDNSLTRGILTSLDNKCWNLSSATVGTTVVFAGGSIDSGYSSSVCGYISGGMKMTTANNLSVAREYMGSTTIGNYALFAGGYNGSYSAVVDAYDATLTRKNVTNLSTARSRLAGTTVGNYALFAGGRKGDYEVSVDATSDAVDVYDKSLTKLSNLTLSVAREELTATTLDGYAIFAGGAQFTNMYATVDVFDESLTRTTVTDLSDNRRLLTSATIGNYALFAGGCKANGGYTNVVDVYEVA